MIRAISFRPVQAFKAGDSPSLKTGNSKIQFAGNDEVSLTKSRGLTEKELKIVDDYVNLLAQLFLKNNDGEVKKFEKDNDIRGLGANPATTRAYSKAKKEKIKEIEKKGLLPEEKQKIDGIADKYVELFINSPKGISMEDYIKFEKDNNILLIRFDTFPNHLNRKNYYNDAIEQRMNKLETDNPEAYQRYLKEKEEDRDFEEKLRLLDELDYGKKTEMFRHIAIAGLALELDPETRDAFFVDNFKNRQGSDTDRNGLNKVNTKAYIKFLRDDLYPLPLYDEIKKAILKEYEDKPEAITLINEAIEDVEAD